MTMFGIIMLSVGFPALAMVAGVVLTYLVMRLEVQDARQDGFNAGWDTAIITAAEPEVPQQLLDELAKIKPRPITAVFRRPVADLRKAARAVPLPATSEPGMIKDQTGQP